MGKKKVIIIGGNIRSGKSRIFDLVGKTNPQIEILTVFSTPTRTECFSDSKSVKIEDINGSNYDKIIINEVYNG